MKLTKITLYKDGQEQCFCWCPYSQTDRLILLLTKVFRIVARFGSNYQFDHENIEI